MTSFESLSLPWPTEFAKVENSYWARLPSEPYVVNRASLKYLYRVEEWGIVKYDYALDQFSAFVNQVKDNPLPRAPLGLYWLVTAPCNLRCIHCYGNVEDLPRENLNERQQLAVADQIIKSGAMRVTINGGEPLLRKDTPLIIEKLADSNISVVLGTNGTYISESNIRAIGRATLVEISLDSHDEVVNNSIRISRVVQGNAYKNALKAIDLCIKHNINLRVLTCINQKNCQYTRPLGDLLYEHGVRDWSVSWTLFAGRARYIYPQLVANNQDEITEDINSLKEKYPDMKIKFSNRSNSSENNRYSCLVFPNGVVFAEDLVQGKKVPFHSLLARPLSDSWVPENFDISQHFKRWTAGRIQYF